MKLAVADFADWIRWMLVCAADRNVSLRLHMSISASKTHTQVRSTSLTLLGCAHCPYVTCDREYRCWYIGARDCWTRGSGCNVSEVPGGLCVYRIFKRDIARVGMCLHVSLQRLFGCSYRLEAFNAPASPCVRREARVVYSQCRPLHQGRGLSHCIAIIGFHAIRVQLHLACRMGQTDLKLHE